MPEVRPLNVIAPQQTEVTSASDPRRVPKPQSQSTKKQKGFPCPQPLCNETFYHRTHLLRHQAQKHGHPKGQKGNKAPDINIPVPSVRPWMENIPVPSVRPWMDPDLFTVRPDIFPANMFGRWEQNNMK